MKTRKSIIEDIKVLKANHKTLKEFAKEKYIDENDVANIDVYMNEKSVFNYFSNPNDPEISNELIDYIESQAHYIPVTYPINIRIHSEKELDQELISRKLKEHYWKQLADQDDDLKNNGIISLILFLTGAVLLSLYFIFQFVEGINLVFNEIFSIAATFLIWESVDYYFLNRNAIKIRRLDTTQLAMADVEIIK